MDNIKDFFDQIEKNPDSEKSKEFMKYIYDEFKNKTLTMNKELDSDLKEQADFLKKLNTVITDDTQKTIDVLKLKDVINSINTEQIVKKSAVPNTGDYKYWYMLQQLVNFTSNQGLKDFVNKNKDKEMRNVWKV